MADGTIARMPVLLPLAELGDDRTVARGWESTSLRRRLSLVIQSAASQWKGAVLKLTLASRAKGKRDAGDSDS